jgi:hypothetical protein
MDGNDSILEQYSMLLSHLHKIGADNIEILYIYIVLFGFSDPRPWLVVALLYRKRFCSFFLFTSEGTNSRK